MIMIDIPEPKICDECPCSYWIRSGEYEGRLMCQAMEFASRTEGINHTGKWVVDPDLIPDNCPIRREQYRR